MQEGINGMGSCIRMVHFKNYEFSEFLQAMGCRSDKLISILNSVLIQ